MSLVLVAAVAATIPADVGVVTVANTGARFTSGAGRTQGDAFGFQARPVRKGAPQGNVVHVVHDGGTATIVASSSLGTLTSSCTKAKVCSAQLSGAAASYTLVDLATGAPTSTTASTSYIVDAVDPDRYGVRLTGAVVRTIGPSSLPPVIESGAVRVAP